MAPQNAWSPAKEVFPKGAYEVREAKAFIDSVGGPEGYQKMQEMIDTVTAKTDELLYALLQTAVSGTTLSKDLRANNHPEALGQLAPSMLAKVEGARC